MSEQSQAEFQDLELFHDQTLGTGSYGKVCRAKFCELPCAAKILHPVLFQFNDPHSQKILQRFEHECELLKMVRHPNIAQYLGVDRDPVSHLPVLLMELLDENLTHFLERSNEPLPYHLQLSLWYDIALALAFLHSKGIIHRDLSGNNVLMIAGSRAKVTDFGMSKLTVINASMSRLTQCPGTPFYMSPEALTEPPVYSKQLDIFSSGVIAVQIVTRKYPAPSSNMTRQPNPLSPTGFSYIPVPEVQRRKNHIDLIVPHHQLLPVIKSCLKDKDQERPTARQLCHQLFTLKQAPEFSQSMQQPTPNERRIQDQQQIIEELQKQNRNLRQEQRQLMEQLEAEVLRRDRELQKQKQEIDKKQCALQQIQTQITELKSDKQVLNTQLRETSQELQVKRRELRETHHDLQQKTKELQQKTAEFQQKTNELQRELQQQSGELQRALQGQLLQESQQKVKQLESRVGDLQGKQHLVEQLPPAFVTRFTAEQLPPNMKKQIEDCLQEWEGNLCKFRLFCERPSSGDLCEKTLEVHKNQTLREATERAYKVLELQECGVQLEHCQLVRYNQQTGTTGKPFDEPKDTPLGEVVGGSPSCLSFDLLMKIKADDKQSSITLPPHEQKSKEEELREASRLGLLEKIADPLKYVSVDAADSNGCSPLYIASWKGHSNIVEELLRREADPNHQRKDGCTPLWVASNFGHQKVVQILLGAGANPDLQEESGFAALHIACQEGHVRVAEMLLQAGASLEQETQDGQTPLYIASWKGHGNIVEELLRREAHVNCQKKTGETPLWTASFCGHQKVVECLLAAGANPDLQKPSGFTALHIACQEGHVRVTEILLQAGASLEQETKDGQTALYVASKNGHDRIVEELLKRQVDVNHQMKDGSTPLWTASFEGHQKVVKMLLTAGANPDLQKETGSTALHVACQEGHDRVAKLLLQAGASVELKTKYGRTPLSIARSKGHERIVQLLLEASRQRSVKK